MLEVYGKHKNSKKFIDFNFDKGAFEVNKIYVTVFTDNKETRNSPQNQIDFMNKQNKDYVF